MIFDVNCAIDIMNFIIDNQKIDPMTGIYSVFRCKDFYNHDSLKKYSQELIFYTVIKLKEGDYIDAVITNHHNMYHVFDIKNLTLRGHEFCEHMKEPNVAEKVKNGLKAVGKHTLSYAESVIKECLVESSKEVAKAAIQQNSML